MVPPLLALLVVFLSPTAWLSATLRRWVTFGALAGSLLGMVVFARAVGVSALRRFESLGPSRSGRLGAIASWSLGSAVVVAAIFRVHLAVVDVGFVDRVPLLTPVFDFYLGSGALGATVYNAVAAVLAGVALAGAVIGTPAALLRWRARRAAKRELMREGGALKALDDALASLASAQAGVAAVRRQLLGMAVEIEDLKVSLAAGDAQGASSSPAEEPDESARPGTQTPDSL